MDVLLSADIGGDGSTISDGQNMSTTLLYGGHTSRLIPACQQLVNIVQESVNRATANATNLDAIFQEQQAYNVNGAGATTSSTYVDKTTLNTTVTNNISGCSLVSGKVQLTVAGTYEIEIVSQDYKNPGGFIMLAVQNVSGGAISTSILGSETVSSNRIAKVSGRVVINQSSYILPRVYYGSGTAATLSGSPHGMAGINNAYLQVKITKLF